MKELLVVFSEIVSSRTVKTRYNCSILCGIKKESNSCSLSWHGCEHTHSHTHSSLTYTYVHVLVGIECIYTVRTSGQGSTKRRQAGMDMDPDGNLLREAHEGKGKKRDKMHTHTLIWTSS